MDPLRRSIVSGSLTGECCVRLDTTILVRIGEVWDWAVAGQPLVLLNGLSVVNSDPLYLRSVRGICVCSAMFQLRELDMTVEQNNHEEAFWGARDGVMFDLLPHCLPMLAFRISSPLIPANVLHDCGPGMSHNHASVLHDCDPWCGVSINE